MRPVVASWLVFVLVAALVAGPQAGHSAPVEEIYRLYCVQCHGTLGNGEGIAWTSGGLTVSPRNHTSAEHMAKLSDEELRLAITKGGRAVDKSDLMPPWGSTLSSEEINKLVGYLRKLCNC